MFVDFSEIYRCLLRNASVICCKEMLHGMCFTDIQYVFCFVIITGSSKERGMEHWQVMRKALKSADSSPSLRKMLHDAYDFPICMDSIRR